MAQSFDAARFSVSGEPVRIADSIAAGPGGLAAGFSISPSGVLAYAPGGPSGTSVSRLAWYGRDGKSTGTVGEPGNYTDVAIAPDGRRIAVHLHEEPQGGNLWMWDASRGNFSQFTFDRSHNIVPIWAPDGRSILFASNRGGNLFHLYRKIATGTTAEEPLLELKVSQIPEAWTSHHGGVVLFANGGPGLTDWTIWQLPLTGTQTATLVKPAKNTAEFLSEFSPDGRWMAYSTADVGGPGVGDVYVRSYPELNGPWRISSNGGNHPRWSPDGRELYYITPDGTAIMAAAITTDGTSVSAATPRVLVKTRLRVNHYPGGTPYDVAPDGRLLVIEYVAPEPAPGSASDTSSFTVVLNSLSLLSATGSR